MGVVRGYSLAPGIMEVSGGWDGWAGQGVPCLTRRPPFLAPAPKMFIPGAMGADGAGVGPGSGGTRHPSLVFLERLNGKRLADGQLPRQPTPKSPAQGLMGPALDWPPFLLGGPGYDTPPSTVPHLGG